MAKKVDKRTKSYKESLKKEQEKLINDPSLAGTTETIIVEVIESEITIEIKGTEDLTEERLKMAIRDNIPAYLLKQIMSLVDCDCIIMAYDKFMDTPFSVSVAMQDGINQAYHELFKERLRRTSCVTCIKRRIKRVRQHIKKLIDE